MEKILKKRHEEYERIDNMDEYLSLFKKKRRKAIKQVLDIRKFEIELYWKRTTFFWTITAAIATGYFFLVKGENSNTVENEKIGFLLGCLGLIFSIGWYFANRGSKFWQVNWEKHLYCMEDKILGPLYKTNIQKDYYRGRFFKLLAPYPFSVTKILHVLNLAVILFWIGLILRFKEKLFRICIICEDDEAKFYLFASVMLILIIIIIFVYTHTGLKTSFCKYDSRREIETKFEKKGIK